MTKLITLAYAGVSMLSLATPAYAQQAGSEGASSEIIVTARRRDESVQDVPLVVNAVTSQTLQKLNIRDLKDITTIVPGLSLVPNANGIGSIATLRGVNFDVNSSGNNGTVEFYINDEPVSSNVALQSMFDVGQIEVLRGPQGTLRGRASPSGSITITTQRPHMGEFGGYLNGTATSLKGFNLQGAINVPIVKDILAIRVAGLFDNNQLNRVHSINPNAAGIDPKQETRSERVTVEFKPTPDIDLIGTYQHFVSNWQVFDQVKSANFADPAQPPSPVAIAPGDRQSVMDLPRHNRTAFDIFNVQAEWRFAGQKLNFVFASNNTQLWGKSINDTGNFFGSSYDATNPVTAPNDPYATLFTTVPNLNNAKQATHSTSNQRSYELRLSSDERLFGMVDYVVGGLINKSIIPFNLWSNTPVFFGLPSPATPKIWAVSNIVQSGSTIERSAFGNVTVHIDKATEISGGLRYISYKTNTAKTLQTGTTAFPAFGIAASVGGINPLPGNITESLHATIYSASIKHRFNENLMIYASTGSSWRASAQTNGIIDGISGKDLFPWGNMAAVLHLSPETSKSYELGIKSEWLDKRLRLNLTYFHQDFKNYFYSAPSIQVAQRSAIVNGTASAGGSLDNYAFATLQIIGVNVPVKVDGVEAEFSLQATPNWDIGGTLAYSSSKVNNGTVPCNVPAASAFFGVNAASFVAANGGQQYGSCTANFRAGNSSPFSATIQSEYAHAISDHINGFIRGLVAINGNSKNDPTNAIDDIKGYARADLFLGLRDPQGMWELTGYAKNIFNTQRVLTRDSNPLATSYQLGPTGLSGVTTYRAITMTQPREFGINLRVSFGSR